MPTVTNPTGRELFCLPLARVLNPRETVEVTETQAAAISQNVFAVLDDDGEPFVAPEPAVEDEPDAEPEPAAEPAAEKAAPAKKA